MSFAQRISHLQPEGAYAVLARAQALEAQGREIIHLEIGQPDFETYSHVALAGIQAITSGKTRYNPPAGVPALRQALAQDAGRRRGVEMTAEQVVVAPGAKPLLLLPMLALLEPGDEVIYPDPGFPSYAAAIGIAGATGVPVPLVEARNFEFDLEMLAASLSPRTRMIILNSPGNPTGSILSAQALARIAEIACRHDLWVLSDEIYSRLTYDVDAASIVSLPGMAERTIIVDGFSKTYAMTGWRLGYGVMPEELAAKISRLATNCHSCTAAFTQRAGMAALTGPQDDTAKMRNEFKRRRDLIVNGLNQIDGIQCLSPRGAFYVFPRVADLGLKSKEIEQRLLNDYGVAALCGTAFGAFGEGHVRFSCANSMENLQKALDRVSTFVSDLKKG
jgi:aspartate aminotransferase